MEFSEHFHHHVRASWFSSSREFFQKFGRQFLEQFFVLEQSITLASSAQLVFAFIFPHHPLRNAPHDHFQSFQTSRQDVLCNYISSPNMKSISARRTGVQAFNLVFEFLWGYGFFGPQTIHQFKIFKDLENLKFSCQT